MAIPRRAGGTGEKTMPDEKTGATTTLVSVCDNAPASSNAKVC